MRPFVKTQGDVSSVILNAVKNPHGIPSRPFASLRVTGESVILNAVKNLPSIPMRPFGKTQGDVCGFTQGDVSPVILNAVKNLSYK
jgi:hypothetical protein